MEKIKKMILLYVNGCEPCSKFKNMFERVKKLDKYKEITFETYDIEDGEEGTKLVGKYQVPGVPTAILLDDNDEVVDKIIGSIEKEEFIELINDCLNTQEEEGEDEDDN